MWTGWFTSKHSEAISYNQGFFIKLCQYIINDSNKIWYMVCKWFAFIQLHCKTDLAQAFPNFEYLQFIWTRRVWKELLDLVETKQLCSVSSCHCKLVMWTWCCSEKIWLSLTQGTALRGAGILTLFWEYLKEKTKQSLCFPHWLPYHYVCSLDLL